MPPLWALSSCWSPLPEPGDSTSGAGQTLEDRIAEAAEGAWKEGSAGRRRMRRSGSEAGSSNGKRSGRLRRYISQEDPDGELAAQAEPRDTLPDRTQCSGGSDPTLMASSARGERHSNRGRNVVSGRHDSHTVASAAGSGTRQLPQQTQAVLLRFAKRNNWTDHRLDLVTKLVGVSPGSQADIASPSHSHHHSPLADKVSHFANSEPLPGVGSGAGSRRPAAAVGYGDTLGPTDERPSASSTAARLGLGRGSPPGQIMTVQEVEEEELDEDLHVSLHVPPSALLAAAGAAKAARVLLEDVDDFDDSDSPLARRISLTHGRARGSPPPMAGAAARGRSEAGAAEKVGGYTEQPALLRLLARLRKGEPGSREPLGVHGNGSPVKSSLAAARGGGAAGGSPLRLGAAASAGAVGGGMSLRLDAGAVSGTGDVFAAAAAAADAAAAIRSPLRGSLLDRIVRWQHQAGVTSLATSEAAGAVSGSSRRSPASSGANSYAQKGLPACDSVAARALSQAEWRDWAAAARSGNAADFREWLSSTQANAASEERDRPSILKPLGVSLRSRVTEDRSPSSKKVSFQLQTLADAK